MSAFGSIIGTSSYSNSNAAQNNILHAIVVNNDIKGLKTILKTEINIDSSNETSQSVLYIACLYQRTKISKILLSYGANPNCRSSDGSTPVHAACFVGNINILSKLIDAGGDLRLHDYEENSTKDWAMKQKVTKKRTKMLQFLEEVRFQALSITGLTSTRAVILDQQSKHQKVKNKINVFSSLQNLGFGKVHIEEKDLYLGCECSLPFIQESCLVHDDAGLAYNNGEHMVMECMFWDKFPVTVKRLHRNPVKEAYIDLLITENDFMLKLRHPNILFLMGVCSTDLWTNLVLIYERVHVGSLHRVIYYNDLNLVLSEEMICKLLIQISDGLAYLHQRGFIHCFINSHAITLVEENCAKLVNFEYMTDSHVNNLPQFPKSAYNWIAPEMISGKGSTTKTDIYGLCAVLWEVLHEEPPFVDLSSSEIKVRLVEDEEMMHIDQRLLPCFKELLSTGLAIDPDNRSIDIQHISNVLSHQINQYMEKRTVACGDHVVSQSKFEMPSSRVRKRSIFTISTTKFYQNDTSMTSIDTEKVDKSCISEMDETMNMQTNPSILCETTNSNLEAPLEILDMDAHSSISEMDETMNMQTNPSILCETTNSNLEAPLEILDMDAHSSISEMDETMNMQTNPSILCETTNSNLEAPLEILDMDAHSSISEMDETMNMQTNPSILCETTNSNLEAPLEILDMDAHSRILASADDKLLFHWGNSDLEQIASVQNISSSLEQLRLSNQKRREEFFSSLPVDSPNIPTKNTNLSDNEGLKTEEKRLYNISSVPLVGEDCTNMYKELAAKPLPPLPRTYIRLDSNISSEKSFHTEMVLVTKEDEKTEMSALVNSVQSLQNLSSKTDNHKKLFGMPQNISKNKNDCIVGFKPASHREPSMFGSSSSIQFANSDSYLHWYKGSFKAPNKEDIYRSLFLRKQLSCSVNKVNKKLEFDNIFWQDTVTKESVPKMEMLKRNLDEDNIFEVTTPNKCLFKNCDKTKPVSQQMKEELVDTMNKDRTSDADLMFKWEGRLKDDFTNQVLELPKEEVDENFIHRLPFQEHQNHDSLDHQKMQMQQVDSRTNTDPDIKKNSAVNSSGNKTFKSSATLKLTTQLKTSEISRIRETKRYDHRDKEIDAEVSSMVETALGNATDQVHKDYLLKYSFQ